MNVFVFGDESGVFDRSHEEWFVFGGVVFVSKDDKDMAVRQFIGAERNVGKGYRTDELKACRLSKKHKYALFKRTAAWNRFGLVVDLKRVNPKIFSHKKSKQRYLDYVFKVGLKRHLGSLIKSGVIPANVVESVYIRFDEHTTATDGRYELREGIEQEFKYGTINFKYNTYHPPLFRNMSGTVDVTFKDSKSDALIRASDIVANRVWRDAKSGTLENLKGKMSIYIFP